MSASQLCESTDTPSAVDIRGRVCVPAPAAHHVFSRGIEACAADKCIPDLAGSLCVGIPLGNEAFGIAC